MSKKVYKSEDEALAAKERAERFVRDVLDDPDRASEITDLSLDEWLDESGRRIASNNPKTRRRRNTMANGTAKTKADLLDEIETLRTENESLQEIVDDLSEKFDQINALTLDEDEDRDEDEDEDGDSDEEE